MAAFAHPRSELHEGSPARITLFGGAEIRKCLANTDAGPSHPAVVIWVAAAEGGGFVGGWGFGGGVGGGWVAAC
ncbi:hypothetical protein Acor_70510 [Acrocarpospora corrugata]|uniref:Uncharacterized protein n=1 Tax=Acrocarpospora corrugata TaxID=35763 RepID=A0A5M3WD11_9ACTN|nr:hypothetical protein Acor_70510 [Acrocarpospora corrugata]